MIILLTHRPIAGQSCLYAIIRQVIRWFRTCGKLSASEMFLVRVTFLILFVSFRWGVNFWLFDELFSTRSLLFFNNFQIDSDSLIFERFRLNQTAGMFSVFPSLGQTGSYTSQFGLGGWLLVLVPSFLNVSATSATSALYTFCALFNAMVVTVILIYVSRILSRGSAFIALCALLQPFPTSINHSTYWMFGLKLLPAVVLVFPLSKFQEKLSPTLVLSFFCSLLVFLSGYEFATTVMSLQLGVLVYFSVILGWRVKFVVYTVAKLFGVLLIALGTALAIHQLQIQIRFKSVGTGADIFKDFFGRNIGATDLDPISILKSYFQIPVIGFTGANFHFFTIAVLLLLVCFAVCLSFILDRDQIPTMEKATWLLWFVTLGGPIGWFMLARSHSVIHPHINPALWFFPTVPLGLAIIWKISTRRIARIFLG